MLLIENAHDLLRLKYPLILLKGRIEPPCSCSKISCQNLTSKNHWKQTDHLCDNKFKILCPLSPGLNHIEVSCVHYKVLLRIIHCIPDTARVVRPVYVVCETNNSHRCHDFYQKTNTKKKIGLAMRLIQSLLAEMCLSECGQRYTFQCADDVCKDVSSFAAHCFDHCTEISCDDLSLATTENLWVRLARELSLRFDRFENSICLVFVACSCGNRENQHKTIMSKLALGSGGLAIVGTSTLHTWPSSLDEVSSSLTNSKDVEFSIAPELTAYRNTYWAAFSTGLGTLLHELGHCFGLDHPPDGVGGIMQRGCDDVNLVLGFPVAGLECTECYKPRPTGKRLTEKLHNRIPPTAYRFEKIHCLQGNEPDTSIKSEPLIRWGRCQSLWHHGGAYWGSAQLKKLKQSPWIFSASDTIPLTDLLVDSDNLLIPHLEQS